MKKTFIISCNPKEKSFSDAIADSCIKGCEQSGREVKFINIYSIDIPYFNFHNELSKELQDFQEILFWADELVFIYPVWCLSIPAKLKSLFETAFQENGDPTSLKGKSGIIIQTYGMPVFVMKYFMGDLPFKLMKGIFKFCNIKFKKRFDFGMVTEASQEKRIKWLKSIEAHLSSF